MYMSVPIILRSEPDSQLNVHTVRALKSTTLQSLQLTLSHPSAVPCLLLQICLISTVVESMNIYMYMCIGIRLY